MYIFILYFYIFIFLEHDLGKSEWTSAMSKEAGEYNNLHIVSLAKI